MYTPLHMEWITLVTRIGTITLKQIKVQVVRPCAYLSSSIKITGDDGSQNNPYKIS